MPSGNVQGEVVNFCRMDYPSEFYSFSLLSFLVQNDLRKPMNFPLELLHIYYGDRDGKGNI